MAVQNDVSNMDEATVLHDPGTTTRRRALGRIGLLMSAAATGCAGPLDGSPKGTETQLNPSLVRSGRRPENEADVNPIEYASLSDWEQSLVGTALEEGKYVADTDEMSPAWNSLRGRVEARSEEGEELIVYLVRNGQYYQVGFVNGDHIIASPTPIGDHRAGRLRR